MAKKSKIMINRLRSAEEGLDEDKVYGDATVTISAVEMQRAKVIIDEAIAFIREQQKIIDEISENNKVNTSFDKESFNKYMDIYKQIVEAARKDSRGVSYAKSRHESYCDQSICSLIEVLKITVEKCIQVSDNK